jgi:hypothetical protein
VRSARASARPREPDDAPSRHCSPRGPPSHSAVRAPPPPPPQLAARSAPEPRAPARGPRRGARSLAFADNAPARGPLDDSPASNRGIEPIGAADVAFEARKQAVVVEPLELLDVCLKVHADTLHPHFLGPPEPRGSGFGAPCTSEGSTQLEGTTPCVWPLAMGHFVAVGDRRRLLVARAVQPNRPVLEQSGAPSPARPGRTGSARSNAETILRLNRRTLEASLHGWDAR